MNKLTNKQHTHQHNHATIKQIHTTTNNSNNKITSTPPTNITTHTNATDNHYTQNKLQPRNDTQHTRNKQKLKTHTQTHTHKTYINNNNN